MSYRASSNREFGTLVLNNIFFVTGTVFKRFYFPFTPCFHLIAVHPNMVYPHCVILVLYACTFPVSCQYGGSAEWKFVASEMYFLFKGNSQTKS